MVVSAGNLGATTYYISPTGLDSNPGTEAEPFRNIQAAADIVNPGDTVIVKDGVYADSFDYGDILASTVFLNKKRGTDSNWITFKSENHLGAVIDGEGGLKNVGFYLYRCNYIRIEGFEIKDHKGLGIRINSDGINGNNIYIYMNKIHSIGRDWYDTSCSAGEGTIPCGISGQSGAYNITVDRNEIYDIGRQYNPSCGYGDYHWDHCVYSRGFNWVIKNNIIYNPHFGWALKLDYNISETTGRSHLVTNNIFAHSPPYSNCGHIGYVAKKSGDYVVIQNNISYNPGRGSDDYPPPNGHFIDVRVALNGSDVFRNNVTSGDLFCYKPFGAGTGSGIPTQSGNITNLPLADFGLADPENDDFILTSSCPYLIDRGVAEYAPDDDFTAVPRPHGFGYDIGPYEYQGIASPLLISQADWDLWHVDSTETVGEDGAAINGFDDNVSTIWSTQWYEANPPHPHEIQIDLGGYYYIGGFGYLPRQNEGAGGENGRIDGYKFYVSSNGTDWGEAVASGNFVNDKTLKNVVFDIILGRYVRLRSSSEVNDNPWATMAELNVLAVQPDSDINNDGKVNLEDFAILAAEWDDEDVCSSPGWCGGADFNMSRTVDMFDLAFFAENWLRQEK